MLLQSQCVITKIVKCIILACQMQTACSQINLQIFVLNTNSDVMHLSVIRILCSTLSLSDV
jgi:hypothetical protein